MCRSGRRLIQIRLSAVRAVWRGHFVLRALEKVLTFRAVITHIHNTQKWFHPPVTLVPGDAGLIHSTLHTHRQRGERSGQGVFVLCHMSHNLFHEPLMMSLTLETSAASVSMVTHIVQVRELNFDWSRQESRVGLYSYRDDL